jgi:hypothetical protein
MAGLELLGQLMVAAVVVAAALFLLRGEVRNEKSVD